MLRSMKGTSGRIRRLAAMGTTIALASATYAWPAIALAQAAPPAPNLRRSPPVWLGLLVMFVLLTAILSISLLPSKRSHQD